MSIYDFYSNDELLTIRNLLRTSEARLLMHFISDFVDECSTKPNYDALETKGMGRLAHEIKSLSKKLESVISERKD
jgi:hypothetical protein